MQSLPVRGAIATASEHGFNRKGLRE